MDLSFWNILPYNDDDDDDVAADWFSLFFKNHSASERVWRGSSSIIDDIFREFHDIEWQIEERMFVEQQFEYTRYSDIPKKLPRKYKKSKGGNPRKVRPVVYDHAVSIVGPNSSRPQLKEFDNIRSLSSDGNDYDNNSINSDDKCEFQVTSPKREAPLVDIITSSKEVKIVVEMRLVNKKDIKVKAYDGYVKICATNTQGGKYHRIIDIPSNVDLRSGKSTYRNGILEIVFSKRRKRSFRIELI